jgi:hypothetical protein
MSATASRDEILDSRDGRFDHFYVEGDSGGLYEILSARDGGDRVVGFARATVTKLLVRFVVTGRRPQRHGRVLRVRIDFPDDIGDVAGTLEFGPHGHVGGWISTDVVRAVFDDVLRTRIRELGQAYYGGGNPVSDWLDDHGVPEDAR